MTGANREAVTPICYTAHDSRLCNRRADDRRSNPKQRSLRVRSSRQTTHTVRRPARLHRPRGSDLPRSAAWRASLFLPPHLHDPTFVNDTIRREHSPPLRALA
jgi:hypothetical protein